MRYLALVTDYDGTLATDGTMAADTVSAIERVSPGRMQGKLSSEPRGPR